jgi:hypothetical protein
MNPDRLRAAPKTQAEFAYQDARDSARAEVRKLTRRLTDLIYVEIDRVFLESINKGEVITVAPDLEAIKAAARKPALELLGAPE